MKHVRYLYAALACAASAPADNRVCLAVFRSSQTRNSQANTLQPNFSSGRGAAPRVESRKAPFIV